MEGRARAAHGRARGLRQPRRRPARAVRGDLRRALVRGRARPGRHDPRAFHGSRPAASSTLPTITRRLSRDPRACRTTPLPSGGAMTATVLLRARRVTGRAAATRMRPTRRSRPSCPSRSATRRRSRSGSNAILFALGDPVEIAISGDPAADGCTALLASVVRDTYRPFAVVAAGVGRQRRATAADRPQRDGRATAYVCRNFACRAPVTEPTDLATQLASAP